MHTPKLTLISHHLCPYVQRAAIALHERDIPFERRNIDLSDKPDWFLALSPLGKVPVLVVDDDTVLFESAVIAQYVDEIAGGALLAPAALEKYAQLAWVEFASQAIAGIGRLYTANSQSEFDSARANLEELLLRVEENLDEGPWFAAEHFTLVDAAFAPAFRYFDVIEDISGIDFFAGTPKVVRWRNALSVRPSVVDAVTGDYPARLLEFLARRDSVIGRMAKAKLEENRSAA